MKNKVVVITGASSGIGQAIAITLAKQGCQVIFSYNSNEVGADDTLSKIGKNGYKVKADLRNENEIEKLFTFVNEKFGKLDILINNAGVNTGGDLYDIKVWQDVFQLNLFASVSCTGKAVELMKDGGSILNVSSIYGEGKTAWKGLPAYAASKAALNNFTQVMAKNLAPKILVNAIAPGYVLTPIWGKRTKENLESNAQEQLIERFIQSSEIAEMALAILKSKVMTGEVVVIDGGLSLKTV
jgi:NAD(P)-dependent dehydrogenase (short-subunit alcohol dehydrogenase family)